jgi:hypothetical protein
VQLLASEVSQELGFCVQLLTGEVSQELGFAPLIVMPKHLCGPLDAVHVGREFDLQAGAIGPVHIATFQQMVRKLAASSACLNVRTMGREDIAAPRSEEDPDLWTDCPSAADFVKMRP